MTEAIAVIQLFYKSTALPITIHLEPIQRAIWAPYLFMTVYIFPLCSLKLSEADSRNACRIIQQHCGESQSRDKDPQQSAVLLPPPPLLTLLIMALGAMMAFGSPPPAEATIMPPCCPNDRLSGKWKRRWELGGREIRVIERDRRGRRRGTGAQEGSVRVYFLFLPKRRNVMPLSPLLKHRALVSEWCRRQRGLGGNMKIA